MRNVQDKIKSVKEVTLAEVRDILRKRKKEYEGGNFISSDNEDEKVLSYVQSVTLDYVNKFTLYSLEDTFALKKELLERYEITESQANQIVGLKTPPTMPEELDLIFDKSDTRFSDEKKEEILSIIQKYSEKYIQDEEEPDMEI